MTNEFTNEQIERAVIEAQREFCNFGYLDIQTAVVVALEVGEQPSWVYEQMEEFADSCGVKISDCDPVATVYDSVLQTAGAEIEELTGFNLCNDAKHGEIYVAGNFCCTSFDYKEEAKAELAEKVKGLDFTDLSKKTQWFLEQLEINQTT